MKSILFIVDKQQALEIIGTLLAASYMLPSERHRLKKLSEYLEQQFDFQDQPKEDKMMELIDRYTLNEVERAGVWFYYGEWSVLNIGKLMETAPDIMTNEMFLGWEAMKLSRDSEMLRKNTWEELKMLLDEMDP